MGPMTYPLIDAAQLRDRLRDGRLAVLDVRWSLTGPSGVEEFHRGHIPGAAFVDLETALAAPPGKGGRHPLPDPRVFETAMRAAGVRGDRPVVVYDDSSGTSAARAWWLLRFHGHPDVQVLDGGWAAWQAAGGATETGAVTPDPGDFRCRSGGGMPVVSADEVLDQDALVDARAPERFRGEVEPVDPVAGHIPGAVNVPAAQNLAEDGRLLHAEQLRKVYEAAGVRPGLRVAAYCGSGVTAAHGVLAMEVAGLPAALYPGSWSEWVADPSRPVATGSSDAEVVSER